MIRRASWNCRGVGNAATVLCVHETQVHISRVEGLKKTLCYDNTFAVSSNGRSAGLEFFWNNNINVSLLPYSQYHIDAIVMEGGADPWRLTCV